MQNKGKGPDASDQPIESGLPDIKQLAWARLLTMLCDEKLSAADLLRVIAADPPQEPARGDLVLYVRREDDDD